MFDHTIKKYYIIGKKGEFKLNLMFKKKKKCFKGVVVSYCAKFGIRNEK